MRYRPWLMPLFLLVLAAPAQEDEGRGYFSLNTDRPILPGESATVRVQAQQVRQLDFRLYRINDPVQFFRQLDDPHHFGGSIRPSPKARTPIEKFAAWKRAWRARFRDVFRRQFTAEARAGIRAALKGETPRPAEQYAPGAILNPQQLVRRWQQPIQTPNRWQAATVPVEVKEKGLYVLEATDGVKQAYTIISVTGLALLTKTTAGAVLVRAVDRATGRPVADCPVQLYDWARKTAVLESQTGPQGLLEAKVDGVSEEGLMVLARRGQDFAAATVGGYMLGSARARALTGYVYTDRPVYRPGHKVHFRSILRTMETAEYGLPKESSVQVEVNDSQGKTVLKKRLSLSEFGTAHGDLDLPAGAPLGYYGINVGLSGDERAVRAYGGFHVEEYRKPDYEVKVLPESKRLTQGGRMSVTIEARYYYGEPVAGAAVSYAVHRYRYWPPWWEVDDDFGEDGEEGAGYGGEQILEASGKLDAQGRLAVSVPAEKWQHDAVYRVEARVTDSTRREIRAAASFTATRGPFFISARPERYVYAPGDAAKVIVETKDHDGNPAAGIPFTLEVAQREWNKPDQPAILTKQGRTGPDGKAAIEFPAPPSGSWQIRAAAPNPSGGEITDEAWLWVSGAWVARDAGRQQRVQIIPDKASYKPGDTAKVLIVAGVPECDLWLSLEGKTLYWSRFIAVQGGTASVEVPIESSHAPNVFLEAVFVRDNTLYRGSKSIKVPPVEKQIQVEVKTAKAEYKPGEPAAFSVVARDHKGQPLSAEFSLGVVDEAIYAIKRETQPDILSSFYGRVWNRVSTDSSLHYYFYGEAGRRRMMLAEMRQRESRAQLKPERLQEPRIRKEFPDTAYWIADLRTGADGRAEALVTFPDSLTTWRATARGVTRDTRVGSALQRTIVRKNILVTIAAPRFLTEGDEIVLPVLVRNYTAAEQKVKVSLQAEGAAILSQQDGDLIVAAKGEGRLDYRVRVPASEKAVLTAKALTATESDALEITLPVEPFGLKLVEPVQTRIERPAEKQEYSFTFPSGASPNWRAVSVRLAPSVAGAVFGALDYLLTYPYGCTEQTMSSFLPNVVVSQALRDLNLDAAIDRQALDRKVKAGLERLYSFQHQDGGWGWWRGDESDLFMTAYVASGVKLAAASGYAMDQYRLNQAAQALALRFDSDRRAAPDTRAYALYAMAHLGKPAANRLDAVWNGRSALTSFGWALLGLTLDRLKDPRAREVSAHLIATALQEGEEAWWTSARDPMLDFESDNSLEATAFAIKLLARVEPDSPLIDKAAQWLVNHRDQGYYWSSTKRTAFVIFGLTDVLRRSGELK
ncbi:MAG: alpha-2-macroglobulin, partial [Candidatus Solibacter usitatus]|nr:alpha-2-macroglobulin [Candidatus Solibacter usitatus]